MFEDVNALFPTGLYFLGTTENTALLSDQSRTVGNRISMQPRIGTDYILAEFREFRAEAQELGLRYFLEVFAPNVKDAVAADEVPGFVNDNICRMLGAGFHLA